MATAVARPARADVPVEETWNTADLYPTEDAWRRAHDAVETECADVARFRGRLGEGPAALLACLRAREALFDCQCSRLSGSCSLLMTLVRLLAALAA